MKISRRNFIKGLVSLMVVPMPSRSTKPAMIVGVDKALPNTDVTVETLYWTAPASKEERRERVARWLDRCLAEHKKFAHLCDGKWHHSSELQGLGHILGHRVHRGRGDT